MPAFMEIFMQQLIDMIDLKLFTFGGFMKLVAPGKNITLSSLLGSSTPQTNATELPANLRSTGMKTTNIFKNLEVFIMIAILMLIIILTCYGLSKIKCI